MEQTAGYLDTEIANAQCGSHPSDDALGSDLSPDAQALCSPSLHASRCNPRLRIQCHMPTECRECSSCVMHTQMRQLVFVDEDLQLPHAIHPVNHGVQEQNQMLKRRAEYLQLKLSEQIVTPRKQAESLRLCHTNQIHPLGAN
eukprot:CAMPEP_0183554066 /NCGR_PEP_ID=MMETSP0371-20130417/77044_1 /TAXON_ID=268820 /ORGANISM="Peridinium aciculiferum, Strain PAER-2" /LENGTH=142 /DNA_ID=CAMNT_0025759785 /DNA_START=267 /DNA_END=695 /DNA_ORIENTATION=+